MNIARTRTRTRTKRGMYLPPAVLYGRRKSLRKAVQPFPIFSPCLSQRCRVHIRTEIDPDSDIHEESIACAMGIYEKHRFGGLTG